MHGNDLVSNVASPLAGRASRPIDPEWPRCARIGRGGGHNALVTDPDQRAALRVLRRSGLALLAVVLIGEIGYLALGFGLLDATYQTLTTITTIGFGEVQPFGTAEKLFTTAFVLFGVGVALYALTVMLGAIVEGHLGSAWERRRMQRDIDRLTGHAIVCGWGRVGKAAAEQMSKAGLSVVVIDTSAAQVAECSYPVIVDDAARDEVLRRAGVDRARTLVATLDTDAASLFVTLSARALNPDLTIIARSRTEDAEQKFVRAGADRVVNPQRIGGTRVAAFALQPHVVDFLDIAMHDAGVEFRLEEIVIPEGGAIVGSTVRDARAREGEGALLLALRPHGVGDFITNPGADTVIGAGDVVIAIGTNQQLLDLQSRAGSS